MWQGKGVSRMTYESLSHNFQSGHRTLKPKKNFKN